jgi:hypothetical protein
MGTPPAFTVKPDPATDTPETVKDFVPLFVIVKVCDALCPTVSEPKLTVVGLTSMDRPVAPPTVPGLPAIPTQPDVINIPVITNMIAAVFTMVRKETRRERKRAFTSAPSRIGMSVITNAV